MKTVKDKVLSFIRESDGIIQLRPAWVAHDFLKAGRRLGLKDKEYDVGERGTIMERWFCSVTHAENRINLSDEGYSYLDIPGEDILLPEALAACKEAILGVEYAKTHDSLDRLIKIYDFGTRLFLHIHQKQEDLVKLGRNSKDEAYYYLDAPLGPHPETFFGVHRYIVERNLQYDIFLPLLKDWNDDGSNLLKYSFAYLNVPGEGFFLDSGILHAPGTALTMEIQESSDVGAIFQPNVQGCPIDKRMLFKDVPPDEVEALGELAVLRQVDWEMSSDPDFYIKRHLYPKPCEDTRQGDICEDWIYYGTDKFSGKRLILKPNQAFVSREPGVHNIFVWRGEATVGGVPAKAGKFDLKMCEDELLVVYDRAVRGYEIRNTGPEDLVLFKYFGPDIQKGRTPSIGYDTCF